MQPSAFDEENAVLDPPQGSQVECLSVFRGSDPDGLPIIISCWKPSREELEEISRTGRVWVIVVGERMPPITVTGEHPFEAR